MAVRRVLVTGGSGFLGRQIVPLLRERGYEVVAPSHATLDLRDQRETVAAVQAAAPDAIIHLAANVGGIGYDHDFPADILTDNALMAASVFEAARQTPIQKLVLPIAACGYPGEATGALREEQFLEGRPHATVEMYAHSRRQLLLGHHYYRRQYGVPSIAMILTNMYGPGDRYHEAESHVAAALLRRYLEATEQGAPSVECWGTGQPVREFIHVHDAAEAFVHAMETYDGEQPINIGTGRGTSIRELAELCRDVTGYRGETVWNTGKPDGAMLKVLDVTRMRDILGWSPPTTVEAGFRTTLDWFREHREEATRFSKSPAATASA